MGRPREFDNQVALDAAVECFWRHGYEATSVRELAGRMGICGTSLYNAYGDKRSLFLQALERYLDNSTRARIRRLEETHSPREAIAAFFEEIIARSLSDRERRGCFLINSAMEVAPHDPALGVVIAERLGEIEAFFKRCIVAAQRADQPHPETDDEQANDLARLLLGVLLGIRVLARSKPDRALLEGLSRPALALLN